MAETSPKPLLHILVVGFHHKKGCQVEFSYPALASSWKYFPTLALPDGSHNFSRDSVYFNLPSLSSPSDTIFGVSCYRQIPVEVRNPRPTLFPFNSLAVTHFSPFQKLKNRTSDVTRSTVQKSVTALCSVPIYGYIEVKLGLIADCFFNQGDFERTEILVNAYEQLNACLLDNNSPYERVPGLSPVESLNDLTVDTSGKRNMFHIGLPLRDLVLRWRQKILVLFKLLLLQRRIVCFGSPVRPMCDLILSIASLHPQLLELGFREVACVRTSRPMSPMPDFPSNTENNKSLTDFPTPTTVWEMSKETKSKESANTNHILDTASNENYDDNSSVNDTHKSPSEGHKSRGFSRDTSVDALAATLTPLCAVNAQEWGAPLPIFTGGCLCLPYLSLPYMDLLTDPSVIGYFIGTSNILFQQKRNLADLLVDVESMQMDVVDVELRRQIQLTTEDLRFFDHILRHVQYPKEEAEGSDRWIREQFQGYVLALLRTTVQSTTKTEGGVASKEVETFNSVFVNQFKRTNCYVDWREANMDFEQRFAHISAGHPFAGTMSVQDVKLKLAK